MILSVSKRTDIPAFHAEWFMDQIRQGFTLTKNPYTDVVQRINLNPSNIDCIVFWTKDPGPLIPHLEELSMRGFKYYFQYTITPYGNDLEPGVRSKEILINQVYDICNISGSTVIWRYDPILFTNSINIKYHVEQFTRMCKQLKGYVYGCVISFLDYYKKLDSKFKQHGITIPGEEEINTIAEEFSEIAHTYGGFNIKTCAEKVNLSKYHIGRSQCIDPVLINKITGNSTNYAKANNRDYCGCAKHIDIGTYGTCRHGCVYCYAR